MSNPLEEEEQEERSQPTTTTNTTTNFNHRLILPRHRYVPKTVYMLIVVASMLFYFNFTGISPTFYQITKDTEFMAIETSSITTQPEQELLHRFDSSMLEEMNLKSNDTTHGRDNFKTRFSRIHPTNNTHHHNDNDDAHYYQRKRKNRTVFLGIFTDPVGDSKLRNIIRKTYLSSKFQPYGSPRICPIIQFVDKKKKNSINTTTTTTSTTTTTNNGCQVTYAFLSEQEIPDIYSDEVDMITLPPTIKTEDDKGDTNSNKIRRLSSFLLHWQEVS